ncbi:MAG: fumarylacetoacetate hydrolase family protein [Cyclobacteriaceae bacterium]|nr:fumarylacetoacetate hydrolase family protein [Cyclobacteriaceae bacterium]
MKLIRFGIEGCERIGIINDQGQRLDVSAFNEDYNEKFFETDGLIRLREWLRHNEKNCHIVSDVVRLGSAIARPSKIICVGLNYANHAKESGMEIPKQPVLFMKSTSSLVGPNDDLIIPKGSIKTDWEVELAVVIGKKAKYVSENKAMEYVAGYVLHNDYSEREYQLEHGGQWVKGKSADTFAPLGPFLATTDEITNPNQLRLWLKVNGEIKQDSNTSDMVFHIPFLVSYISQYMSLLTGDVISTGTPEGVGLGFKPPQYLRNGDIVELGINGLGTSRQHVKNYFSMA